MKIISSSVFVNKKSSQRIFFLKRKAFTLVELIVIITILAILGTISYISLQGYSKVSRDSVRISDISLMKTSLELFHLDAGKYPNSTDSFPVTYSGVLVWNQGTFGEDTTKNVDRLDKVPKDPLTEKEYTYSVTKTKQEYQIAGILETDNVANNSVSFQVNAEETIATAFVEGNYNGILLKTNTGAICEILSVPSIISSGGDSVTNLIEILSGSLLVYDGYNNLPPIYDGTKFVVEGGFDFETNKLVVYSDDDECQLLQGEDLTARVELIENLQEAYSGTIIENEDSIERVISFDETNTGEVNLLSATLINNTLGGNIVLSSSVLDVEIEEDEPVYTFTGTALGGTDSDYIGLITNDSSGNIFVGGYFKNDEANNKKVTDFNNNILLGKTTTNTAYGYVAKLDNSLNQVWIKTIGGKDSAIIRSVYPDNFGNVYVGGLFDNDLINTNNVTDFNGNALYGKTTNNYYSDAFIAKLDSSGNQLWIKVLGGSNTDGIMGISGDSSGNVYVGGYYYKSSPITDFAGNPLAAMSTTSGYDSYVAKLDSLGNQLWIKTLGGKGTFDRVWTVDTDTLGNVYLGGTFHNDLSDSFSVKDFAGNPLYGKTSGGIYTDIFVVKLDSSGNQQWIKVLGGTDYDYIYSLKVGSNGNVFVGGKYINTPENTFFTKDFSDNVIYGKTSNTGTYSGFVSKLNSSGNQQWIKTFGGRLADAVSYMDAGESGNLYVGGFFYNNISNTYDVTDFSNSTIFGTKDGGGNVVYLANLDSGGNQLWIKTQNAWNAVDITYVNGEMYIGGLYYNDLDNSKGVIDYNGNVLYGKTSVLSQDVHITKIEE